MQNRKDCPAAEGFLHSLITLPLQIPSYDCCCLFSCYQTASNTDCWTIHTLFIAITTSCFEKSASAQEFPVLRCFIVPEDFCKYLSTEFAAYSQPPAEKVINHCKASYPRTQQYDQGAGLRVEPRSCDRYRYKTTS